MNITNEMVKMTIHQIVNTEGADFVYQKKNGGSCLYVYDEKPDCLVGRVLHALGVDLGNLSRFEGTSASGAVRDALDLDRENLPAFVDALDAAQRVQDRGDTWGEALAEFDRVLARALVGA